MNPKTIALVVVALFALLFSQAIAKVPQTINYQGRLLDSAGDPVADDAYLVKFIIYDHPTKLDPGNIKWNSNFQTINTVGGLFTYALGTNTILPDDIFIDTSRYLGLTVGTDPELSPRTRFTSTSYSYAALRADTAGYAEFAVNADLLDGLHATSFATLSHNHDAAYSALSHAHSAADLTSGTLSTARFDAYNDLSVGGRLDNNATTDLLTRTQLDGRFVAISGNQTIFGSKTFTTELKIGDSTFMANNNGVRIGDVGANVPSVNYLLNLQREYNTTGTRYGTYMILRNQNTSTLYGNFISVGTTADFGGNRYGLYAGVQSLLDYNSLMYGVFGTAGSTGKTSGASYGVYGSAFAGSGASAYGIYGYKWGSGGGYAGYFLGNVGVTGTLSKGGGSFKIDHPLDPENKYLQHSFVESPDMMNVYNGNIITDANGEASINLPEYFTALNRDFRYQLTVIGEFAQAIVASEIVNNFFMIKTDKPNIKVSWQVTGIRQDKFAEANRIQVTVEKEGKERGRYLHFEEYGVPVERSVDYENIKEALKADGAIKESEKQD